MLAALACLFCVWRIDPQPGNAVLAIVLSISLGRSQIDRDLYGRIEAAFVLPAVAVACAAVDWLLHWAPAAGALAYMSAMALSIWIRRFGPRSQRAGGLIALPFVTLLAIPVRPSSAGFTLSLLHGSIHLPSWMLPVLTGWLALFWVGLAHLALARIHGLSNRDPDGELARGRASGASRKAISRATDAPTSLVGSALGTAAEGAQARASTTPSARHRNRLLASTRMALQMAVALGAAFAVGRRVFPAHWAWIVLTALIVNLGNRGRLDVLYKGIQRFAGAAAGTLVAFATGWALSLLLPAAAHPGANGAAALFALFLGMWLRPFGYVWWALFVTIALSLLQGLAPLASLHLLGMRLIAIAIGAMIGVIGAWWVYPIDSGDVLLRRLADALTRLGEAFDPDHPCRVSGEAAQLSATVRDTLAAVTEIAPAFRAARRLRACAARLAPQRYLQALSLDADRIDALIRCGKPACEVIARGAAPSAVRRAVGVARRTLREPSANLHALLELAEQLEQSAEDGRQRFAARIPNAAGAG